MKNSILVLMGAALINFCCSQSAERSLDGKSFQLSVWDVNQPDQKQPDVITFQKGNMDPEGCHQYGFTAAPYTLRSQEKQLSFVSTCSSPTDGTIVFEGVVTGQNITGTMVWTKTGQADIRYEYTGTQITK